MSDDQQQLYLPEGLLSSLTTINDPVPVKPKTNKVVVVNSTSASIWVDSWLDGGCPIMYFIIEYQTSDLSSWSMASNSVQPNDRVFVLSDLKPGTKYNVRITAHNNAGSSLAVYNFTTLSPAGGQFANRSINLSSRIRNLVLTVISFSAPVSPTQQTEISLSEDVPFYFNLKIIILVFVISTIFTTLVATAAFIRRKSE